MFCKPTYIAAMVKILWEPRQSAFRQALRDLRKQAGLSQVELAARLDKPQSFVSKYESGERRLEYIEVEMICRACNTTLRAFAEAFERDCPWGK
ncbi:transcriptional regulator with XRE-family HTH domain [Marinobacterium sp. MBR-111]|jgi:transcriptional regulator with XRE-family HTH domain|uniref:helix-turn-helix domain-containing protein n=1 Tax=Marinobacterium sp. MBR-111 TaxID=3156463 RepID=UPI0033915F6D